MTLEFESVDSVLARPEIEPDWLINGLMVRGCASLVFAPEGCYKTTILLDMAAHIAGGKKDFLGFGIPSPGPVLYFFLEGGPKRLTTRLKAMPSYRAGIPIRFCSNISLRTAADWEWFESAVKDFGAVLVILDPLLSIGWSGDMNDNQSAGEFMRKLDGVGQRTRAAIALTNHRGKPSHAETQYPNPEREAHAYLGAQALSALADSRIVILRGKHRDCTFVSLPGKDTEPQAFRLQLAEDGRYLIRSNSRGPIPDTLSAIEKAMGLNICNVCGEISSDTDHYQHAKPETVSVRRKVV